MSQPTRALADFLNHGVLPFVGREKESERLRSFWCGTTDANGLRAALISGEAGIGKSRLVEEIVPEILASGGAVIHTKLYQESATTLVPLLAKSVWHSVAGRELLKAEPEANFESLNTALRRIASLRPTAIIIEDIQHMQSGGSRELANLLDSLSHETLSLILTMRPASTMARSVVEQYLTEEIALEGLTSDAFVQVCDHLFEGKVEPGAIAALERASLGNALAVRSALRGALKTGFLDRKDGVMWKMSVPPEAFFRHLENNVRSLSEGMASHLDEAERVACESLAVLGELFAVEAADLLISNASDMIDRLRFKGMITTSASAHAPLLGEPSSYPLLAFSHSLLHKYFYDHTHLWGDEIARLLTERISLYGIAPYLLLEKKEIGRDTPKERLLQLLKNMVTLVSKLDSGSDWELCSIVHDTLAKLFERYRSRLTPEEDRDLEFDVLRTKLTLMRRSIPHPEFKPTLDKLVELSGDIKTTADAERRLAAVMCEYWYWRRAENADVMVPNLRTVTDEIACAFPDVVLSRPYRILLTYMAQYASELSSQQEANEIDRRINVMLAHPDCTEEIRRFVLGYIYPEFLNFFSTREGLEERLRLAERIESTGDYLKASLFTSKADLLLDIGHLAESVRVLDTSVVLFREHGFRYSLYSANIKKIVIAVLLGKNADNLIEEAKAFIALLPPSSTIDLGARRIIAQRLVPTCMLVGRDDIAMEVVRTVMPQEQPANPEHLLLLALRNNQSPEFALSREPSDKRYAEMFMALRSGAKEHIAHALQTILGTDLLRLNDILGIALALEIARIRNIDLGELTAKAIANVLTWLHERELAILMAAFIEHYGELLPEKEERSWKQKLTKLRKKGTEAVSSSNKILISMLGTIEYKLPDGSTTERIRGARLRSVLGVMTANLMLSEPLGHKEFCAVAAGEKEDFELARKTVNMAVAALRDALGADAILTTGDTPMLNLDRVNIDLLEASDLLHDATRHLRRSSIMKAFADLNLVMQTALGKVPFPTLYDNLFEALRDDFDARLRKTTLDLGRRLLTEGDTQSAITLLRRFFDAIPDDDEIANLLRDALIQLGQSADAERIRIKTAEVVK